MKTCSQCGKTKDDEFFTRLKPCQSLHHKCNDCLRFENAERNRLYRERNREAINARLRVRRQRGAGRY